MTGVSSLRVGGRWHRYWFGPGGRTAAAVLRIAVAVSVLWTLWRLGSGYLRNPSAAPHDLYRPVGINRLYQVEPSAAMLSMLWYAAWASTLAMLLGWRTRTSTVISVVTALALASYEASFGASWSHDNNAPLLAQLALLGARTGDALSVDAWLRARRGDTLPTDIAYRWPVLLVQLAIGIMMASAAVSKLASGKFSLDWALSDNLRNQILIRFDYRGLPREAIADWIVDEPWRWQAAALGNIVAQLVPLAAAFLVRRPMLRALCGLVFVVEVIGLAFVMGFWNFHWLPLAVAFVDWDALLVRDRDPLPPPRVGRGPRTFVIAYVALDLVIAFWRWPKLDQRANLYPFSSFPMFASIRAVPPYDEHRLYEMFGARLELVSSPPPNDHQRDWIHHRMMGSNLHRARSPDAIRTHLEAFRARLREAFPDLQIAVLRAHLTSTQARPYPEPARLERVDVAILGELEGDTFRSLLGATPPEPLLYESGQARPLVGAPPSGKHLYVLAKQGDRAFVVAPGR